MKTLKEWDESGKSLTDYLKPGDEVDKEMVDYFMDLLPPHRMSAGYLQVGEPYDHIKVEDIHGEVSIKGIYATFHKEAGKWIYKGHCVSGTTMHRVTSYRAFE